MDGFKKLPKMKTGGCVEKEVKKCGGGSMKKGGKYKEGGDVDLKQDKALIKKAFKQHDKAEHDKEPTEIKLKKGNRVKKEAGTVKKYKAGGAIEMKKSSGDLDTIKKVKATGAKKADAPSKAEVKPNFKGSDVEKEKSKLAGDKDTIKKVPPTGDKKADAPNKAAVKPDRKGINAVDDIDGMKKGRAVKKYKAGGPIKHMADGSLAAPIDPAKANFPDRMTNMEMQQMMKQRALQAMLQKAGMQGGQQAQQAGNPNAMNTTFNANQPPAYVNPTNAVMNNPYSRSGQNPQSVDELLNSPAFTTPSNRMLDK
jgi:hypothetical protein